ncbi:MAG: hypothetical protein ACLTNN_01885 [Blautia sp.]
MRAFSRDMLRRYVEIPARACRAVDQNHMILGMRWAWISDPDLVEGWENFDVFSINCYAVDPTSAIQNIVDLGVDLLGDDRRVPFWSARRRTSGNWSGRRTFTERSWNCLPPLL